MSAAGASPHHMRDQDLSRMAMPSGAGTANGLVWAAEQRRRWSAAWTRFWFEPRPTSTLALFRIVYGLLVALWALALLPDASTWLSDQGVLPEHPQTRALRYGLLAIVTSDVDTVAFVGLLAVVGLLLAAGAWTRLMSIVSFVLLLSIGRRNPEILNSGDSLLRDFGFFLMFAPAGEALSWDRYRRTRAEAEADGAEAGGFWAVPLRAPWALRLIQIQVSLMYLFSTFAKAQGDTWAKGLALGEIWRAGDLVRFNVPFFLYDSVLVSNVATFATMATELALALLIWNRAARPFVIAAGLLLHAGIEFTMTVGFFSMAACAGYLAFIPEERAEQMIAWLRRRAEHHTRPVPERPALEHLDAAQP